MVQPTAHLGPSEEARIAREGRGAKDHRAPSHISKTVLSTVHLGPPEKNRTERCEPAREPHYTVVSVERELEGLAVCQVYC